MVDSLSPVLDVVVRAANVQDRDGAKLVLAKLVGKYPRLRKLWADSGHAGALIERALVGWILAIVKRSDDATGFVVLPRRWIAGRTYV